jgi:GT2 family glycosyltransferase
MDLCLQVAKLGYRIVYYPDAEIVHLFGQSSKASGVDVRRHLTRSKFYYFRKNFPLWHAWVARLHSAITT